MFKPLEEVEHRRPRGVGRQDDGVLVGRLDRGEPVAPGDVRARADLGIPHAQDVPLDVVAGQLAAGVELDALAQVELDLLVVGRDVPALGQHRLDLAGCRRTGSGGRRRSRRCRSASRSAGGRPGWGCRRWRRSATCRRSCAAARACRRRRRRWPSGRRRGCGRSAGRLPTRRSARGGFGGGRRVGAAVGAETGGNTARGQQRATGAEVTNRNADRRERLEPSYTNSYTPQIVNAHRTNSPAADAASQVPLRRATTRSNPPSTAAC